MLPFSELFNSSCLLRRVYLWRTLFIESCKAQALVFDEQARWLSLIRWKTLLQTFTYVSNVRCWISRSSPSVIVVLGASWIVQRPLGNTRHPIISTVDRARASTIDAVVSSDTPWMKRRMVFLKVFIKTVVKFWKETFRQSKKTCPVSSKWFYVEKHCRNQQLFTSIRLILNEVSSIQLQNFSISNIRIRKFEENIWILEKFSYNIQT